MTSLNTGMRALSCEELDAVTGGIINGCIKLPTIIVILPPVKLPTDLPPKTLPV